MLMALYDSDAASPPDDFRPRSLPSLAVHSLDDAHRAEVEAFIGDVYARRFGARLTHFAPMLVSLRDADGRILAAAGYRSATDAPLFLERYLSSPVEALLVSDAGMAPARQAIVEVGHLAAVESGEGRRLLLLLGPYLAERGFQWVVSTLTQELRRLFVRLGVTPLALGIADPTALGDDAAHWGSYYDHRPVVLAGQLQQALRRLSRQTARTADDATPGEQT